MLSSYFFYRCSVTDGMEDERSGNAGCATFINPLPGTLAVPDIQLINPKKNHIKQQQ